MAVISHENIVKNLYGFLIYSRN